MLPQVLISPFGGVWADRYNRKHLIMLADGFIALATCGLAISFLLGCRNMGLLLMVSVIRSVGAGIQMPAVSAMYPQLVPKDQLFRIQGINQTLVSMLMLLSPAVGGVLLGTAGIVGAFFTDAITAVLAIAIMSVIKASNPERSETPSIWSDLHQGVAYTFRHPGLRRIVVCYASSSFFITPAAMLTPLMVERSFGNEVWRLTASEIVWAAGSLIGGVFVALRGQFQNTVRTIATCVVAFGITFGLLGASRHFAVYLFFMGAAGFFMPLLATAQTVYIQEIAEPAMLGRVFSIVQIVLSGAMPAAIVFFGPLADVVRVENILLAAGVLVALTGLWYGLSTPEREA
jgi:DHA3 family macrolide efflux protein-like MFS transporter